MSVVEVTAAARSEAGRSRQVNEDRQLSWVQPAGEDSPLGLRGVLAVADGRGGAAGGEASTLALETLKKVLSATADRPRLETLDQLGEYLYNTVRWINDRLLELGRGAGASPPGCTLTVVAIRDDGFVVAHAGDSSAWRLRGNTVQPLTESRPVILGAGPDPEVIIGTGDLRAGDRLVVCSDGVAEYISTGELAKTVGTGDLQVACDRLQRLAAERDGEDNMTTVLGLIGPLPVISTAEVGAVAAGGDYAPRPTRPALRREALWTMLQNLDRRQQTLLVVILIVAAGLLGKIVSHKAPAPAGEGTKTAQSTTEPKTDTPKTPDPAPAAPKPVTPIRVSFDLSASGKHVTLVVPKDTKAPVTLVGIGKYKPEQTAEGWQITLNSPAAGQAWTLEPEETPETKPAEGADATPADPAAKDDLTKDVPAKDELDKADKPADKAGKKGAKGDKADKADKGDKSKPKTKGGGGRLRETEPAKITVRSGLRYTLLLGKRLPVATVVVGNEGDPMPAPVPAKAADAVDDTTKAAAPADGPVSVQEEPTKPATKAKKPKAKAKAPVTKTQDETQ